MALCTGWRSAMKFETLGSFIKSAYLNCLSEHVNGKWSVQMCVAVCKWGVQCAAGKTERIQHVSRWDTWDKSLRYSHGFDLNEQRILAN